MIILILSLIINSLYLIYCNNETNRNDSSLPINIRTLTPTNNTSTLCNTTINCSIPRPPGGTSAPTPLVTFSTPHGTCAKTATSILTNTTSNSTISTTLSGSSVTTIPVTFSTLPSTSTTSTNSTSTITSIKSTASSICTPIKATINPKSIYKDEDWNYTKVLSKKGANLRDHNDKSDHQLIASPIDGDFQSFIRRSSFWIDKSLWIEQIDACFNIIKLITAPPKWGKTINLFMLKFYFELQTDSNGFEIPRDQTASYRYFKEGKVTLEDGTTEELDELPMVSNGVMKNLANYPVIYINGSIFNGSIESFRIMIHATYNRHKSLLARLLIDQQKVEANSTNHTIISQRIEKFCNYYDLQKIFNQVPQYMLPHSIQILSKLLSETYNRRVVILYDDYDRNIYNTFFNIEQTQRTNSTNADTLEFSSFIEHFMGITFRYNLHLATSVITGVTTSNFACTFSIFHVYQKHIDFVDPFPYFGIFQNEFHQMAQRRGISQRLIDEATQWYGGYRTLSHLHIPMYAPYSLTRFINTLQIREYRPNSTRIAVFLKKLLKKPELQNDFQNFVDSFNGNKVFAGITYGRLHKLAIEDYRMILKLQRGEIEYNADKCKIMETNHRDVIFSLMVHEGYAAVHPDQILNAGSHGIPTVVNITIPNQEIYNELRSEI